MPFTSHTEESKRRIGDANRKPKSAPTRRAMREAWAAKRARGEANRDAPPHRTRARYHGSRTRAGCRCDECREAWRRYKRERKAAMA